MEYGRDYGIWASLWNMVISVEYGHHRGIWTSLWNMGVIREYLPKCGPLAFTILFDETTGGTGD